MKQRRWVRRLRNGLLAPRLHVLPHPFARSAVWLGATASGFARADRGVALLEFSLIMPFLIALLLGSFELTRYINTTRQITNLADSIAQLFAQNTTGSINDTDLHFAIDSTMVTFPNVLGDAHKQGIYWWQDIYVSMSSVSFTPTVTGCTSNCTYNAKVMWTTGARPCSTNLTPASDTAPPSLTTLPTDAFGPGSMIVVDIAYNYRPIVATNLLGVKTISRSTYLQPRYVSSVKYAAGGSMGTACPGMN